MNRSVNTEKPSDQILDQVLTSFSDDSICRGSMEWTVWNSASGPINGNDFEILADHVKFFG